MTDERFRAAFPDGVLLSPGDAPAAAAVLARAGIRASVRDVASAGVGNMNIVLRAATSEGSLILKQSPPWVARFPQIAAPADRFAVESAFYRAVESTPGVADAMAPLLGESTGCGAIVLGDLGPAVALGDRYHAPLGVDSIQWIMGYLDALHRVEVRGGAFRNRAMRRLNHAHIFLIPLGTGGPDLDAITPGLAREADRLRRDAPFVDACRRIGEIYLADGPVLLHGDMHPGSVLSTGCGLRVIDPEFAFCGAAEFDLAVLLAHAVLGGHTRSEAAGLLPRDRHGGRKIDRTLVDAFAGVEIMRRLIGVAQLPLDASLDRKTEWLRTAHAMVLGEG